VASGCGRSDLPICHYPAIIEGDAETGYSVFFPDIPGCTSGGDTLREAALNAEEALAGHVALMAEAGQQFPLTVVSTIFPTRSSRISPRSRGCS
jgi:predicted RNase H-like HicB family nuclease